MKKIFSSIIILLILIPHCQVQGQTDKKNIVKINFLSPIVRTISTFYERQVFESSSLQLGLFYSGASQDDQQFRGFGITPEFRYYLSDKGALEGFFLAPYLRYQNLDVSSEGTLFGSNTRVENKVEYELFGGGLLVGGQWIFKDVISVDVWGGPGYNSVNTNVISGSEDELLLGFTSSFTIRFGATIGVAF